MIPNHLWLYLFAIAACCIGTKAIVGGATAAFGQFPYQVSIQYKGKHFCGGAIIRKGYVLSAAHCFVKPDGEFVGEQVSVVAGTGDLNEFSQTVVSVPVKRICVPSIFNAEDRPADDIAVLKLNRTLSISRFLRTMRLKLPKTKTDIFNWHTAQIAGFGLSSLDYDGVTESYGQSDSRLRYAITDIVLPGDLRYHELTNHEEQITAVVKQHDSIKRGTCSGDGGSILVHNYTAIGVLSVSPLGCSEEQYGAVYTRVSIHAVFLRKAMSSRDVIERSVRTYDLIK